MRKIFIAILSFLSLSAFCAPKDFGAGIMLGNPTGLNGKYWLSEEHAIDGGFGLSPGSGNHVSLHSDYLWHKKDAFYFNDTQPLDLYYGLGARMEFDHDIEVGVRVPVGLAYVVEEQGADMFAEIAPVIDFITRKGLELHLAFGARFYFR
jgi:hypothetical protein